MDTQTGKRPFISGRKAAEIIGCSRETVRRLTADGRLDAAAVDGSGNNLYDPETVATFAATWTDGRSSEARQEKWHRQFDERFGGTEASNGTIRS